MYIFDILLMDWWISNGQANGFAHKYKYVKRQYLNQWFKI